MRVNVYWKDMKSLKDMDRPGPDGVHVVRKGGMIGLRIPLRTVEGLGPDDQAAVTFWAETLVQLDDLRTCIENAINEAEADLADKKGLRDA